MPVRCRFVAVEFRLDAGSLLSLLVRCRFVAGSLLSLLVRCRFVAGSLLSLLVRCFRCWFVAVEFRLDACSMLFDFGLMPVRCSLISV